MIRRRRFLWAVLAVAAAMVGLARSTSALDTPKSSDAAQDKATVVDEIAVPSAPAVKSVGTAASKEHEDLAKAYASRRARLQGILADLERGVAPPASVLEELIEDPRDLERLVMDFERKYLDGLQRYLGWRDRERLAREAELGKDEMDPFGVAPVEEEAGDPAATGDVPVETVVMPTMVPPMTEAEIRASPYPEPLASLLYEKGLYREALWAFESIPETEDKIADPWILLRRARCRSQVGDMDGARDDLTAVSAADPEGPLGSLAEVTLELLELDAKVRSEGTAMAGETPESNENVAPEPNEETK